MMGLYVDEMIVGVVDFVELFEATTTTDRAFYRYADASQTAKDLNSFSSCVHINMHLYIFFFAHP